jgi:hypothetical protein
MSSPTGTTPPALSITSISASSRAAYNDWLQPQIGGVAVPGTLPRGGLRGFARKTGWDIKSGKGVAGATLTLKDAPPVEGVITSRLLVADDFDAWDAFVASVLSIDPEAQKTQGLAYYYPGHASIGLTAVVIQHYTGPEHQGGGVYHVTIEVLEWAPPPAQSIVSTVATTKPDVDDPNTPPGVDPTVAAQQATIALLQRANQP